MELSCFNVNGHKILAYRDLWDLGFYHGFTTGDMDMGYGTGKSFEKINAQVKMLTNAWGLVPKEVFSCYQVHGDAVALAASLASGEDYPTGRIFYDTDGMVSPLEGVLLMTKFADCVPLIFFDPVTKVQANVHSGWKGTLLHIGARTIETMEKYAGVDPKDLHVIIGPSIHQEAFEVEKDVADPYRKAYAPIAEEIISQKNDIKYHIDLQRANQWLLMEKGVRRDRIYIAPYCTHRTPWLHSYRRDGESFGLMAALSIYSKNPFKV